MQKGCTWLVWQAVKHYMARSTRHGESQDAAWAQQGLSPITPSMLPMAATMEMIQQMTFSSCKPHHLAENMGIFFCAMCIWICTAPDMVSNPPPDHASDLKLCSLLAGSRWQKEPHRFSHDPRQQHATAGVALSLTGRNTVRGAKPMAPAWQELTLR